MKFEARICLLVSTCGESGVGRATKPGGEKSSRLQKGSCCAGGQGEKKGQMCFLLQAAFGTVR